jgi:hypothetical protein
MSSLLGWLATAVTAGSYLSRQAATLKKIQAAAACLRVISLRRQERSISPSACLREGQVSLGTNLSHLSGNATQYKRAPLLE